MKLIIDISEDALKEMKTEEFISIESIDIAIECIKNGIPLDDVKAEIAEEICLTDNPYTKETKYTIEHLKLLEILDSIGKAESEDT